MTKDQMRVFNRILKAKGCDFIDCPECPFDGFNHCKLSKKYRIIPNTTFSEAAYQTALRIKLKRGIKKILK